MSFFNSQATVRISKETIEKVNEILDAYPERFETQSQVMRAAVNYMHRKEVEHE